MRRGGSYIAERGKKPQRVEGTEPHPEGPRARDAEGNPLDDQGRPVAPRKQPERPRDETSEAAGAPRKSTETETDGKQPGTLKEGRRN